MKVITSIYLNCRPDLRDEWLTGVEPDDAGDAQVSDEQDDLLDRLTKLPDRLKNKRCVISSNSVSRITWRA